MWRWNINVSELTNKNGELLIDFFLQEQQQLTAVEKFAQIHADVIQPLHGQRYRDLIPLSKPGIGEQYAFEVDLDACTGCKACVTGCHSLNGLDEDEVWRSVGLLQASSDLPMFQMVTTACHHCAHPACMDGCPVKAYDKDPLTGIVRHLDDQCIGCQFCILKCPYDVPKYNKARGIVRKCDMCSDRLGGGEAPACVQACPNSAIRITTVNVLEIARKAKDNEFLPATVEARYTLPTTRYKRKEPLPEDMLPADAQHFAPQQCHSPLVFMLVLTQLSVGAFFLDWLLAAFNLLPDQVSRAWMAVSAWVIGMVGLNCAALHLGRPLYAYRAVLGLRTSWLSREIVCFGAFALCATLYTALFFLPFVRGLIPAMAQRMLPAATALSGILSVICSSMIYVDTRREFWSSRFTFPKFLMTTLLLGSVTVLLPLLAHSAGSHADMRQAVKILGGAIVALTGLKLAIEASIARHLRNEAYTSLKKTALLMERELAFAKRLRIACGIIGGILLPVILMGGTLNDRAAVAMAAVILALSLAGELLERYLFFSAVVPLKMPGAVQ